MFNSAIPLLLAKLAAVAAIVIFGSQQCLPCYAYDRYYLMTTNDTLIIGPNFMKADPANKKVDPLDFESKALTILHKAMEENHLPSDARIRVYFDCDGKIERLVLIHGKIDEKDRATLTKLVGVSPAGPLPAPVGLTKLVLDFDMSEFKSKPMVGNLCMLGGTGALLERLVQFAIQERNAQSVPQIEQAKPKTAADTQFNTELKKNLDALQAPSKILPGDQLIVERIFDTHQKLLHAQGAEIPPLLADLAKAVSQCPIFFAHQEDSARERLLAENVDGLADLFLERYFYDESNWENVENLMKDACELKLKMLGFQANDTGRLCKFLQMEGRNDEACAIYKTWVDQIKKSGDIGSLDNVEQAYADALLLADDETGSKSVLAEIDTRVHSRDVAAKKKAEEQLSQALKLGPTVMAARLRLCYACYAADDVEGARGQIQEIIAELADPRQASDLVFSGSALSGLVRIIDQRGSARDVELLTQIFVALSMLPNSRTISFRLANISIVPETQNALQIKRTIIDAVLAANEARSRFEVRPWLVAEADCCERLKEFDKAAEVRKKLLNLQQREARNLLCVANLEVVDDYISAKDLPVARKYLAQALRIPLSPSGKLEPVSYSTDVIGRLLQASTAFANAHDLESAQRCASFAFDAPIELCSQSLLIPCLNQLVSEFKSYNRINDALNIVTLAVNRLDRELPSKNCADCHALLATLFLEAAHSPGFSHEAPRYTRESVAQFKLALGVFDQLPQNWKIAKRIAIEERKDQLIKFGMQHEAEALDKVSIPAETVN
ncbi:MAG TPA: hypothetical protein V6C81_22610 [Planktothrix sp.]